MDHNEHTRGLTAELVVTREIALNTGRVMGLLPLLFISIENPLHICLAVLVFPLGAMSSVLALAPLDPDRLFS